MCPRVIKLLISIISVTASLDKQHIFKKGTQTQMQIGHEQ